MGHLAYRFVVEDQLHLVKVDAQLPAMGALGVEPRDSSTAPWRRITRTKP